MNELFDEANIISCYTWDNAVDDGLFINITEIAQKNGFNTPVAVTTNLYTQHLKVRDQVNPRETNEIATHLNIVNLLRCLYRAIKKNPNTDRLMSFEFRSVTMWASIEARSPNNREPVMTILLPEDY